MKRLVYLGCLFWITALNTFSADTVVLLHGLTRSHESMHKMMRALEDEGYAVLNIDYPSTRMPINKLADLIRGRITGQIAPTCTVHFVTHSMGGIILRYMQQTDPLEHMGRAVMLSPPNRGSEIVDKLGGFKLFKWINGPAGLQLGTGENSFVSGLRPPDFELGIITGDRSINWILSGMISGKDDGKVSIENAKVEGMADFRVVHAAHPFIMNKGETIELTIRFLRSGTFKTPSS